MTTIKLGEEYEDSITGFRGTATARFEFLYGCVRILLEGQGKDGKPDELTVDEQRVVTIAGAQPQATATSGGPRPGPPSRDPQR